MSGSPPPENRSNISHGIRHSGQSTSPTTGVLRAQMLESVTTYQSNNSNRAQGIDRQVNEPGQRPPTNQSIPQYVGLPSVNEIRPPHLLPAFGSSSSISQRTTTLPPRSTRRAKAHVASACVNCKRKHLGCDSARPCRRCVVAGKEESCVDVTHKRRGRPPLKAEEGPIRPYESAYGQAGVLRVAQHPSIGLGAPRGHKRTLSSREIRPSPDYNHFRPYTGYENERKMQFSPTSVMQPPLWTAPILPSPSTTIAPSPYVQASISARRPASSGQQIVTQRPQMLDFPGRDPLLPRGIGDISPIRSYSGDSFQNPHSPHHSSYKPQSPSESAYFSSPGPPGSRSFAPMLGGPTAHSTSVPDLSSFRLPPIIPRTVSDSSRPKATPRPRSNSSLPWMERGSFPNSGPDRIIPSSAPIRPVSPVRRGSGPIYSNERRISAHEIPPMTPLSLPPLRNSELQKPHSSQQRSPHIDNPKMATPASRKSEIRSIIKMDTKDPDARPAKRLRMELGEMVND
ncbi:hypothetical protein FQN57_004155 [Myotisia sp. PD_48]|nr:hypothetical protein FQN57_004155 [Myotisia sp. PD_48]